MMVTKVPVTIKLEDIKVVELPNHKKEIMITDKIGMTFKYPTMVTLQNMEKMVYLL